MKKLLVGSSVGRFTKIHRVNEEGFKNIANVFFTKVSQSQVSIIGNLKLTLNG